MTFEKHLRSVSRAASQRLGILKSPGECSMIDRFLGDAFGFCPASFGVQYCSAVWCSVADTHLKLLDRAVCGARFLTEGLFECDIYHCRSVAVLCMLYKIMCIPMHPLNGALPGPYMPVRVTLSALVAHRYTWCSTWSVKYLLVDGFSTFYFLCLPGTSVSRCGE